MFGNNPKRPPEKGDGSTLLVQHIFATIQGEGPFAGMPSVFIRLGGCNLACKFCDTEFEAFEAMTLDVMLRRVIELSSNKNKLVVITGGEPFRQPIAPLCEILLNKGFQVQIETNGTLWREIPAAVSIICSPKQKAPLRPDITKRVMALKYIISAHNPTYSDIPEKEALPPSIPIYVQPMDEQNESKNKANLARATMLAAKHGYKLSLQVHKALGIE